VERGVVRGRAAGGSKGGVREGQAPFGANKDSIKMGEDRGILKIGPSELPVRKWDFNQPEIVDGFVKKGSFRDIKIVVRLIAGRSGKVEIAHDGNRTRKRCKNLCNGVKEKRFLVMNARAINVDNRKGEVVGAEREGGSYRELIN
jgi:hypothetical protein